MSTIFDAAAAIQGECRVQGWPFCFIGGIAVQRWAEPRATADVDLAVLTGFGGRTLPQWQYEVTGGGRVIVARAQALRRVLWIGGPPGAGKSSVATRIARRWGLRWYGADTRTWQHRDRALAAGNRAARRWEAMTPHQRWVDSTPEEMLAMSLHAERGPMVIDDLRALPGSPLVIAEGTSLPAAALTSGVAERARAVWLLPTREFQQAVLASRDLPPGRMALYLLLTETIEGEARAHGARILPVVRSGGIEQTVAAVEEQFAEALAEGPRAETLAERRALVREANQAVADQVRGYHARPWATGDAEAVVCEFACECADPDCDATVPVPVASLPADPVHAPDHG